MNDSLIFATEGFALNLNLFETNVINLAVVAFGLYKFLPNFLGGMLERRRSAILQDLKDAEDRLAKASESLKQAKLDLSSAEQKAGKIRTDCQARAEAIRLESEKRTVEEMARIKQGAASDLNVEAARVSGQLRREAAKLAIEKALSTLSGKLDDKAQDKFLKQSIKNIGDI
ncbi:MULTISPECIES: F0F1 ATP synthase subunit B [Prochlorococcus]|uniref:ATP synthase subunit b n=1 Tax=Prochlorococcus marinus (strain SARG / CCMP1375 / SS120) TaxID=167539 RepID=ATPF_PROMA|nr:MULTISPECIES: F0F1 ATP synthase subunit B [Prochlorococcus]Q7VA61.1 RecName: Full=ATP synthase subunit b; AltName: Full=ATP synthase F(0) sector subunit b; AltName: Full=ATPase subunit I; AltName: Full=F-type ATPase subunit b; Short=F-ATPase subunit b [Prochlorococcus marinus subsp. marinus str. CCMP1375]AAQ00650.1 ATP synthase chain b [Prochlorococcus marinus subsp. marinus str. CCMP1375]KGG10855.1 ATP synthase B chain [Prochlorococcus marinus str. LG]KGG20435.1 ATP synthase B chain [Prochl